MEGDYSPTGMAYSPQKTGMEGDYFTNDLKVAMTYSRKKEERTHGEGQWKWHNVRLHRIMIINVLIIFDYDYLLYYGEFNVYVQS